ncbi:MAG: indole-3-glycerol phosphate synthase TrpC [Ilumatobacteraceae bacterium]|nr:indole-3-glycerol phosphate synthase TrpC [Ilumatobacteraceae bacterium]
MDRRPIEALIAEAAQMPATRDFAAALRAQSSLAVIAEIKRRSPSKGDLFADLDPVVLARAYESGGASCLSVLTDSPHFGGSVQDLQLARSACSLPVVRKDFTVSERDVLDTRIMGADCVLLIAAALDKRELKSLHELATSVGLDVLVEIHDEAELDVALTANASIIGVNQRDLVTFRVDNERAVRMAALIPASVVRIAESGVRDRSDAQSLRDAGYDAVLVGESLVTAADPAAAIAELRVG